MADLLNIKDLKDISDARLREAKILLRENEFDGSVYLAGYAVETALKARICKILNTDYPPSSDHKTRDRDKISTAYKTHSIDDLIILAGLKSELTAQLELPNVDFKTNWSVVTTWDEQLRYKKIGTNTKEDAEDIIEALENKNNGVLTWIKKLW